MNELQVNEKKMRLPSFLPDATSGAVRGVDSGDLKTAGIDGLMVNTYHLMASSAINAIESLGGIHSFMNWPGVIASDSGGFQIWSLIRKNPKFGTIRNDKVIFRHHDKKLIISPEKNIRTQLKVGADIIICLDDCTGPNEPIEEQEKSVDRTLIWAKKSKTEFEKITKYKNRKPLIFAVVQGGNHKHLRKKCADELLEIGFDGFGFGGFPINDERQLVIDILEYTAKLIPDEFPKFALGIGKPEDIVECYNMGYNMFDCVLPTRSARQKILYVFKENPNSEKGFKKDFYEKLYLQDDKYFKEPARVSEFCDCYCCKNYSRSYLYHLFKLKNTLSIRLATLHNLRFYSTLLNCLRSIDI